MARRIDAYVDTSALIAFVDRSDAHHALFRRLFANPPALLTSTLVVAELHGWFLRRYGRTQARHDSPQHPRQYLSAPRCGEEPKPCSVGTALLTADRAWQ